MDGLVRHGKTLAVMPTYTCPAACNHCGSISGPAEKTRLSLDTMIEAIQEAAALGFRNVVFTGGEATLSWNDLLICMSFARDLGLPCRLVTNAHWATSEKEAGRRLEMLMDAGLTELNLSTGDEHARFIPIERVVYAIAAALKRSLQTWVVVESRMGRDVIKDSLNQHPLLTSLPPGQQALLHVDDGAWMPLDPATVWSYAPGMTVNRLNVASRPACTSVLQTYTLRADGKIAACCGIGQRKVPELTVGEAGRPTSLSEAIKAAESDFIKLWLRYFGPEHMLAWAKEKNPAIEWEGMYAHQCQACLRVHQDPEISRLLKSYYSEMSTAIALAAWLDEVELPDQLEKIAETQAKFSIVAQELPSSGGTE